MISVLSRVILVFAENFPYLIIAMLLGEEQRHGLGIDSRRSVNERRMRNSIHDPSPYGRSLSG